MSATVTANFPNHGWKGSAMAGTFTAAGFDSDPTWQVSGLPAGLSQSTAGAVLTLSGVPTESGIADMRVTALGPVSGLFTTVTGFDDPVIIEGDGWLAGYHLEGGFRRTGAIDLQYNVFSGTWRSGLFDVSAGLPLNLGQPIKLHALIASGPVKSVDDAFVSLNLPDPAPTDVSLVVRPLDQRDGPELLTAISAGTEEINGSGVFANYFDLTPGGRVLGQIFRALNKPSVATPDAATVAGSLQMRFTLAGTKHITKPLRVNFAQPY